MLRRLLLLTVFLSPSVELSADEPAVPVEKPKNVAGATESSAKSDAEPAYEIEIDFSQTPELKDWVETKLRPTLVEWYPIIIADLPSNGFTPPHRFTVTLQANGRGVAATGGSRVSVNAAWITQ